MKFAAPLLAILVLVAGNIGAAQPSTVNEYRQLTKVEPLPVALDPTFEFRKAKLFFLGDPPKGKGAKFARGASKDPTVGFESTYRLYGAVTALDRTRRYGHYFDFFWRAKKSVPVTVRLEYRQEKLRLETQAREVSYANAHGSHKTAFAVIGDDFSSDGRVLSWRCLLIQNGRIVAEERSYLWR